jgi:hypothetical protein
LGTSLKLNLSAVHLKICHSKGSLLDIPGSLAHPEKHVKDKQTSFFVATSRLKKECFENINTRDECYKLF